MAKQNTLTPKSFFYAVFMVPGKVPGRKLSIRDLGSTTHQNKPDKCQSKGKEHAGLRKW